MVLALSGAAFYAGGTNRLEMYNYFLDMKSNMVYKYKYGQEYYDIVMSQYQYDEHYVVMRKIQPILANWEFLDEKMLLWATDERIALIEKWAEFAYLLEDGLSQFPQHNFVDEEETTTATTPSSTEITATQPTTQQSTQPTTQPTTTLPVIDETYYGITGDCMWELKTLSGVLTITGNGNMASYSSASSYPWYKYNGYVKQIIIKYGVKSIGSYAFSDCSGLTGTIEISKSVQSIGECAFRGTKPSKIIVPFIGKTRTSISQSGILGYWFGGYTTYCNIRQYYSYSNSNGYSLSDFAIPSSIKEVVVTDTTRIPYGAFSGCNFIEKITLSDKITNIEGYAFQKCSGLTETTIPEGVTSIGSYAFYGCSNLKDIFYPKSVDDWNSITLGTNNDILKTATIHFNSLLGDVNQDGNVNIKDVSIIQMYLANFIELSDEQKYVADVDSNGDINIIDATQIQKYIVQLIPSLG